MGVMRHASSFLLPPLQGATVVGQSNGPGASTNYALVVLNQRIPRFTPLLWEHAGLHLCADGGANRVYDEMPLLFPDQDPLEVRRRYKPDVIKGDMDSLRKDVKDFYSNLGSTILDESHDQDTTDLHKCVSYINSWSSQDKLNLTILVAGALGGRFDHEAGNINVLYKFADNKIVLLSDDCLIFLLAKKHYHEIYIQPTIEGPHCGLIPVGAPSMSTTTTGLQWNLTDAQMAFGDLISTSNLVREEKITVQSASDLLWTISLKKVT